MVRELRNNNTWPISEGCGETLVGLIAMSDGAKGAAIGTVGLVIGGIIGGFVVHRAVKMNNDVQNDVCKVCGNEKDSAQVKNE